ncbi:response regulator [bacterium DOLZORAL124_64_63]|nr:MAG: response regulator [bacterium DOLZORAL124_64_63]
MKILIADDSGTARMFIKQCLEISIPEDVEFLEAANGQDALKLLKAGGVDLLVTDLNMPVLDGRELIRRVSASPRLTGLPMMVITSSGNKARQQELLDLGAQAVLRKPVNPMKIAEGLESVLNLQGGW